MKQALLSIFTFLWCAHIYGQIYIDAEIRPRTELRNGYNKTQNQEGRSPEFVTSQRSGIGLLYKSKVTGYINFQDVRTWGESTVKQDVGTLHLKEGWIEINMGKYYKIKAGRQILKYDNQRILSAANWNQIGNQHDVLLLKYKKDKLKSHVAVAYNNENASQNFEAYYPIPLYKMLFMGWFNYEASNMFKISLLGVSDLNQKDSSTTNYARYTFGGTMDYKLTDNLKLNTTNYYQTGKINTGISIAAYMLTMRIDAQIYTNTAIFAGADLISGKNPYDTTIVKEKVFNRLYGSKHKYLGYLDYFPANKHGISDSFIGFNYKFNNQSKGEIKVHNFILPHEYSNPGKVNQYIKRYLGTEMDIKLDIKISPEANLSFIHGLLFASPSMDYVLVGNHQKISNYAMLMLTWNPKIKLGAITK